MLRGRLSSKFPTCIPFWSVISMVVFLSGCTLLGISELTISWETESEIDIIGFNLLRSESEDGPFVQINDELIPPAADPNVGGTHTYVDDEVVMGVTYYYILETIDRQGRSSRSDPIAITASGSL